MKNNVSHQSQFTSPWGQLNWNSSFTKDDQKINIPKDDKQNYRFLKSLVIELIFWPTIPYLIKYTKFLNQRMRYLVQKTLGASKSRKGGDIGLFIPLVHEQSFMIKISYLLAKQLWGTYIEFWLAGSLSLVSNRFNH